MSGSLQSNPHWHRPASVDFPQTPDQMGDLAGLVPISPYPRTFLRSFELLCESKEYGYRLVRELPEQLVEVFRGAGQTFEERYLSKFLDSIRSRVPVQRFHGSPIDIFYDTEFGAVRFDQCGRRESLALLVHIADRASGRSLITHGYLEDSHYFLGDAVNLVQFSSKYPGGFDVTPLFSEEAFSEARADLVIQLDRKRDHGIHGYLYRLLREQACNLLERRGVPEDRWPFLINNGTRTVAPHVLFDPEARQAQSHSSRELYQAIFFSKGSGVVGCRLDRVGHLR